MSANHTPATAADKPVLEMTDEELQESYHLFFPDGQPSEPDRLEHYATEFEKISQLRDVPVRYAIHSQVNASHV